MGLPSVSNSGLSDKVFLAYNAKARDKQTVLDNTPRALSQRGSVAVLHATALPGTQLCITRHVKDVFHCLGGISLLFPLFAQLDQPSLQWSDALKHSNNQGRGILRDGESDVNTTQQMQSPSVAGSPSKMWSPGSPLKKSYLSSLSPSSSPAKQAAQSLSIPFSNMKGVRSTRNSINNEYYANIEGQPKRLSRFTPFSPQSATEASSVEGLEAPSLPDFGKGRILEFLYFLLLLFLFLLLFLLFL